MARTKIDPAISRKAYADATKQLKLAHPEQFARYLDEAYADLGVDSPRVARAKREEQEAEKRLLAAQKRQARQQAKIEEAKALLEAAGLSVLDGTENVA